jgi:DNA-binding response OmpR family regulator
MTHQTLSLASSASPSAAGWPRALRVVVADDDHDTADTLAALLRGEGYDARTVYDGVGVTDAVSDFVPDAVLLDIGMPGRSGFEIARSLCERFGSATPMLIAITGWTKPSHMRLAELSGFDRHIAKPYDPDHLLRILRPLAVTAR